MFSNSSLDLRRSELELQRYCFIEPSKKYTRNLIATDNETYTLLLMCWNPGKFSPIHDHPCDGCWMRVVQGSIREIRYEKKEETNSLSCTSDNTFVGKNAIAIFYLVTWFCISSSPSNIVKESEHTFIDDNQGYHKIGNPSENQMAMTIHLYSPPIKQCHVWMDVCQASNPSTISLSNFSEYGCEV